MKSRLFTLKELQFIKKESEKISVLVEKFSKSTEKLTKMGLFLRKFLDFEIRLHLPISFFSAKCNVNWGNLIGPLTVFQKSEFCEI